MQRIRIMLLAAMAAAGSMGTAAAQPANKPQPAPPAPDQKTGDKQTPAQPSPDTSAKPQGDSAKPQGDAAKPQGDAAKPQGDAAKPQGDAAKPEQGTAQPQSESMGESGEPTAEDIEKARQVFSEGHQLFQAKDYANAVIKFKEAYRLSKNPLLLYNIGFTLDMNKERDLALFYYEKFLKDAGPSAQVYDEVKARVEAIKRAKEAGAAFDTGSMGKITEEVEAPKPQVTEFQHKVVEETPPAKPLDITAFIPEGSGWQVTLFYRAAGEDRFDSTLMRPRYNELVGRIPAIKATGKFLQYYIEVRDKTGKIVERSGRAASPHLVFVDPNAKPRFYPDLEPGPTYEDKTELTPIITAKTEDTGTQDLKARNRRYAKWGFAGATVGVGVMWFVFRESAANMAISLEREVDYSTMNDICPSGPPCRSFSEWQKDVEARGERFEALANLSLAVGLVSASITGYLWYKDYQESRKPRSLLPADTTTKKAGKVSAVPVIGRDFVGGAALLNF